MEVQKVEMKDARTPEKTTEKTNAPKTAVSYTHLDVYKRQGKESTVPKD